MIPSKTTSNITREACGRRVELADPGRSLILTKPTGAVPHKGGVRFDVGDRPYQILSAWISQGAGGPRDDDARVSHLEVHPAAGVLPVGAEHDLVVIAQSDDGRARDVTRWARFTAANESVAAVDEQTGRGPGGRPGAKAPLSSGTPARSCSPASPFLIPTRWTTRSLPPPRGSTSSTIW